MNTTLEDNGSIYHCIHCGTAYHWKKSSSYLKMSYCSELCEVRGEGITIKDLIYSVWERVPQEEKLDEKFSDTKDKKKGAIILDRDDPGDRELVHA